jgi:hypothetical protein
LQGEQAVSDIFLSYKRGQRREARQLAAALASRGWMVWWDWNIPAGADWQAELDRQLDAAGCVVVLWSAESVASEWVLYEARHALRKGTLVQALLEPVQPPAEFSRLQAVDLAGWDVGLPFHAGFDRLCAAIRALLDRRAPLEAIRGGGFVGAPTEAGEALRRDATAPAGSRARPAPVMLPPPPFADLLDRKPESAEILATLGERRGVTLSGASGIGKTALLCHAGNLDHTERFHDGVVYLQAAALGINDLAQAVHEAFFDVAPGVRPSAIELRRNLADKTALLIVDDAALSPAEQDALAANAPRAVFVFASEEVAASGRRRLVALGGLPAGEGVRLFERVYARALDSAQRAAVERIVEAVRGQPARIEQAAGVAVVHGVSVAEKTLAATPDPRDEKPAERRVLAALACAGAVPLEAEQCAAIAGVDNVGDVLAGLVRRGLALHAPPGFRLAAGMQARVEATPEYAACRQRATGAFLQFAFEARGSPRRVARLAAPMTAQMAWAAEHGRSDEALRLARALDGPLAEANRWDAWRDMLSRAYEIAMRAGDDAAAGWALHQQGTRALMEGDQREAKRLLDEARRLRERRGDAGELRVTRDNLRLLGWSRLAILLAVLGGLGVTTLGAVPFVLHVVRPIAAVAPGTLDFGVQDLRAAGAPQAIQIGNDGRRALGVIDVRVEGAHARSFSAGSSCNGIDVPAKLACRLLVEFRPDGVGAREATIVIRARGVDDPLRVSVRGVGAAAPIARLGETALDFGEVELGSGAERRLALRNEGSAPLTVTGVTIDGDAEIRVTREGCTAAPVAPDAQCAVELRFVPSRATAHRAQLTIRDNASGSPRAIALTGIGHATLRLDVAPGSLPFGAQEVGTRSAARSVRVRNAGNAEVGIQRVTLEGGSAFQLQDRCANTRLAPGADCAIDVRFAPETIEAASGRIVIAHSAGSARTVELSGNGFGRPAIEVAPAQVDFGLLKPRAAPPARSVTIANVGTDTLLLRPPRIDGDARFSVNSGCPERLAPRARCSVAVGVDASRSGRLGARLVVGHNAAGGSAVVALTAAIETIAPPAIERFDANPAAIDRPRDVELCFRARNAQRLAVDPPGAQPQSNVEGCVTRYVGATTTFRLTASGETAPAAQAAATVTLSLRPPPPPPPPPQQAAILDFRANPTLLTAPGATQLCFRAQNAEYASIAPGGPQPSAPNGGCVPRRIGETTTFTLSVGRQGSAPVRRDTTVTVAPVPPPTPRPIIERFDASAPSLDRPREVQLCFRVRNAQRLTLDPAGAQPQSNSVGCVTRFVGATTTFRLNAYAEGAAPAQAAATVTLAAAPPPPQPEILRFSADPPRIKQGQTAQLCFSARNAESASILPGGAQPSSPNGGCVVRQPAETTKFTLTVSARGTVPVRRETTVAVIPTSTSSGQGSKDGVVKKDTGVLKAIPRDAIVARVPGWCCRAGNVTQVPAAECRPPGQWFRTEAEAKKACPPPPRIEPR